LGLIAPSIHAAGYHSAKEMTPAVEQAPRIVAPWTKLSIFAVLVLTCYAPTLKALVEQWFYDPDMGHGIFVPLVAGYIIWNRRAELMTIEPKPNWWGLVVVIWGGLQMIIGALGTELFTSRTAFVITVMGVVLLLGGTPIFRKLLFPLSLLFLMVPIPAVIYNQLTFPLQILASRLAAEALSLLGIPVFREGNILDLPSQRFSVVEACSGIRSLLSLTFLSLVYGYFFEKKTWVRVALFLATIPIAILANGSRVTITGILSEIRPDLAEGFFHESTGLVIFFVAAVILFVLHKSLVRLAGLRAARS
jgi:exosortase